MSMRNLDIKNTIKQSIRVGAPLFNKGEKKKCLEMYLETAKSLPSSALQDKRMHVLLAKSIAEAREKFEKGAYGEGAWILRNAFDKILLLEGDTFTLTSMQKDGEALADAVLLLEKANILKDRKYRLKTYKNCFVGKDAVDVLLKEQVSSSRTDATSLLNKCLNAGLIYHVTKDHDFKDETLFYKTASLVDLRHLLSYFKSAEDGMDDNYTHYAAVLNRYKQYHKHPSLGVIRLDYNYPPAPGDIDHPDSYDYPVYYRVVPGLTFDMAQSGKMTPEVEKNFDEAVLWLANHKDVSAITGDCGFMMWFVERARGLATKKPIFLSALMQLPSMASACAPSNKILIFTANGHSLDPMRDLIKRQCGVDSHDSMYIIIGCENVPYFGEPVQKGLKVDTEKAEPGIVKLCKEAVAFHPDARMILFECTELPPYSDAVREATRLPVFDSITNCNFVMDAFLDNQNFGLDGWYEKWDGVQESYQLGQNLTRSSLLDCLWCHEKVGHGA